MVVYKSKKKRKDGKPRWGYNLFLGTDPKTGKQKRITKETFKTRKEATTEYNRMKLKKDEGEFKPTNKSKVKVKDIFEDFITHYSKTGVTGSTIRVMRQGMEKHIVGTFGDYYISEIEPDECYIFLEDLGHKLKNSKVYRHYLSQLMEYAKTRGIIRHNPVDDLPKLKNIVNDITGEVETVPKYYTEPEMKILLEHMKDNLPHHKYTFFLLLAYTGLRRNEALALQKEDIDINERLLTIDKTLQYSREGKIFLVEGTKSRAKNQEALTQLPLHLQTVPALEKHIKNRLKHIESDFFFYSVHPNSVNGHFNPSTPAKWLNTYYNKHEVELKALGINHRISCHGFRHSFVSMLRSWGYNPDVVRQLARHKDLSTTDIYSHWEINSIKELMDKNKKGLE